MHLVGYMKHTSSDVRFHERKKNTVVVYTVVILSVNLLVVVKTVCCIVLWFTFLYAFRLELATLRVLNREGFKMYISINRRRCQRCSTNICEM